MIQIKCIKCDAVLEIDDGFAGGVCRCIHCRKMQAVPKGLKGNSAESPSPFETAPQAGATARMLPPSGAAGSGLSGSGLASGRPVSRAVVGGGAASQLRYWLVGSAGLIVVMSAIVLWLTYGREQPTVPADGAPPSSAGRTEAAKSSGTPTAEVGGRFGRPAFCGLIVEEPSLVYLVDRSALTSQTLAAVKQALSKSLDSLRSDQRFQIIFWNSEGEQNVSAIPAGGPMRATADACAAAMADLISPESGAAGNGAITESEEPPAAAAIAQPDHSAATFGPKEDFSDNSGPPGQTFTPKTAFWLKAITVKGFANSPQSFGQGPFGRVTLSISQLDDGGVLKRLRQESATGGFSNGGAYQTFTLASPLVLAAGKTYAYDLFTEQGFYGFAKSASDVYAGGAAMQHGDAPRISADGAPLTKAQASDRTFFINPVASESGGKPALERAFAQRPSVIVLVSGRAYDETFASRVLAMRNAERVKLNVVLVGDAGADVKGMRRIVEGSGGEYRQITADGVARGG